MTTPSIDAKHTPAGAAASPHEDTADVNGTSIWGSTLFLDMLQATNRLNNALQRRVAEMLDSAELTLPQWLLLCHLRTAGAGTLTEAAVSLNRDSGGLSRAAHLLRERQLIHVTREARDRRSVQLSITPAGIALCERVDLRMSKGSAGTLNAAVGLQSLRTLWQLMDAVTTSLNGGERPSHNEPPATPGLDAARCAD